VKLVRPWIALVLSGIVLLGGSLFYAHSRWLPHLSALPVKIVAHAWWWEFDYPTLGIKTSDELHLPSDRWIRLDLQSADVVHSFWIDGMSKAIDLRPGKIERLDLRVKSPGQLYGNCDAGCGCGTVCMRFRVLASTPSDFNRWAARQKNAPQQLTLAGSTVAPACAVDKSIDHQGVPQASRSIDPSIKKNASSHGR
jgi:cytochrome c oxidase subunit II